MYVRAPVSSNMITTTETVMCIIPLKAAPAPRKAYVPGVIHVTSGSQAAKNRDWGKDSCRACTRIPTVLPNEAPIAMDGTNIPAGTLQPYEIMTRKVRTNVEKVNDSTIFHRFFVLNAHQYFSINVLTMLTRKGHYNRVRPHILRRGSLNSPSYLSLKTYLGNILLQFRQQVMSPLVLHI